MVSMMVMHTDDPSLILLNVFRIESVTQNLSSVIYIEEGFGNVGAFPELHYPQYPLDMGRKKVGGNTLPISVDEHNQVRYDVIVRHGENAKKIVFCHYNYLVPKFVKDHDGDLDVEEKEKLIQETT
ncbi:hypothetical protein BC332_31734 [Capsicum chinense]|nr:hypothetical protein BC332_31734 [Capsicum chinense]